MLDLYDRIDVLLLRDRVEDHLAFRGGQVGIVVDLLGIHVLCDGHTDGIGLVGIIGAQIDVRGAKGDHRLVIIQPHRLKRLVAARGIDGDDVIILGEFD